MASKYRLESSDIYLPGSSVPRNKAGITDPEELHELERELLEEAYLLFYDEMEDTTRFDEAYFRSLHRRTLEGLYGWAGVYRHFNMAKGESRFCQGAFVEREAKKIFAKLEAENFLKDYETKPREAFAEKIAYFQCELIALHPFYEINGRITRLFFDMIAAYNGYRYIDYAVVTPRAYIDASIECVQLAECSGLESIIASGLKKQDEEPTI